MKKKLLTVLMILMICVVAVPTTAFALASAASTETESVTPVEITPEYAWYNDGVDTDNDKTVDTYIIATIGDLVGFAKITQGDVVIDESTTLAKTDFANKTIKLGADLIFADNQYWYYADGTTTYNYIIKDFAGTFDGNNKTISEIKYYAASSASTIAFFDKIVDGGSIKNLTIDTVNAKFVDVTSTFCTVASTIVGEAFNCHVKNVTVNSDAVLTINGFATFSGANASATQCTVDGLNVTTTYIHNKNASLKGAGFGSFDGKSITHCDVKNVTATTNGIMNPFSGFGDIKSGICNNNTVDTLKLFSDLTMQNCSGFGYTYADATVNDCSVDNFEATTEYYLYRVGGFTAHSYGDLKNCTVSGVTFSTVDATEVGGFAADAESTSATDYSTYNNCRVDGIVINISDGASSTGGFIGQTKGNGTLDIVNCHVTGLEMTLTGSLTSQTCAGFVGEAKTPTGSYTNCSVAGGIDAKGVADTDYPIGGFVGDLGWSGGSTCTFKECVANVNVTSVGPAGGFIGQVKPRAASTKSNAIFTDCVVNGSVTSTSGSAGGFAAIADSGSFESCNVNGNVSGATATGGFIGEIRPNNIEDETKKNVVFDGCVVSENVVVEGNDGMAGGLIGYVQPDVTTIFEGSCTPANESNVNGTHTSEIANSSDKIYLNNNENIIVEDAPAYSCYGAIGGFNLGYLSIQAAVNAKANVVTLLNNSTENFTLDKQEDYKFTFDLSTSTYNGTITIVNDVQFTIKGTSVENNNIVLTVPLKDHHLFKGWYSDATFADGTLLNENTITTVSESGVTYYAKWEKSAYSELPEFDEKNTDKDRTFDFGSKDYGSSYVEQYLTFEYNGTAEQIINAKIVGIDENNYFQTNFYNLTVTIVPIPNLTVGTYKEFIHVTMHDGSTHTIIAKLVVNKAKVDIPTNSETYTYNGSEQKYTLTPSDLYTITNDTRIDAGSQTVTISLNDTDNYEWTDGTIAELRYTFEINPKVVSNAVVEISTQEGGFVYTGSAITPNVTVKDGDTVIPASEYEVNYSDNIDAGTAKITITDVSGGNYVLTGGTDFIIAKADPIVSWPTNLTGIGGSKLESIVLESGFAWNNADTVIACESGQYEIKYTPEDTDNYNVLTNQVTVNGTHTYGDLIAKVEATCSATGFEAHYFCDVCDTYFTAEQVATTDTALTIAIDADAHSYGVPTYVWSDDNSTCTATRVCSHNNAHTETENATVASEVTQPKSCTNDELTKYTATFTNSAFATQIKENVKTDDKLGHTYGGGCDADCNVCGDTRTPSEHVLGDDNVCDICGYETPADDDNSVLVVIIIVSVIALAGIGYAIYYFVKRRYY